MLVPDTCVPFRIAVRRQHRAAILVPAGELDLASATALEVELKRVWESEVELVVVDLRDVLFMDLTGLRVIVTANQHAHKDDRGFAVVDGCEQVHMLLRLTGMLETITVVETPEVLLP